MIRRTFLKTSTLTVVGVGVAPLAFFSGRPAHGSERTYDKARFEALLNHWFYVDDDAHPTLELVRIDDGPASPGLEQFTAVFRGSLERELDDAQHRLITAADDPMDLHLSPAGADTSGAYFAARFCLHRPLGPGACAPTA
jgi:hypothetical protein